MIPELSGKYIFLEDNFILADENIYMHLSGQIFDFLQVRTLIQHYSSFHRNRAGHHPEMNKDSAQPAPHPYEVISDNKRGQSDDTNTYCHINGMTALPPGVAKPMYAVDMKSQPNVSLDDLYSKPNKQRKVDKDSHNASDYACVYGHVTAGPMDDGMTSSGNEELNYVEIDHSGMEGATRNEGSHPESEGVTYAEIQPKIINPDTSPLDGDMDMSMVENDLYLTK